MHRNYKKIISLIMSLLILTSSCVFAQNDEAYTITKLNDYVSMYHITSEAQKNLGVKGGEGAQLVFSMDMSHQNENNLLLSNDTVGIYRSEDNGKSWIPSADGIEWTTVNTIRYDIENDQNAYAYVATSSNQASRVNRFKNTGFYKSYDGGKTWTQKLALCSEKAYGTFIAQGKLNANGKRSIYTGAQSVKDEKTVAEEEYTGLFKSTDGGETFISLGLKDRSINSIYADLESDIVIVASDKGIDISKDGGETFTQKNSGLTSLVATAVCVNPLNKNHIIIGIYDDGPSLWQSKDLGENWGKIDTKTSYGSSKSQISHLKFAIIEGKENPRLFVNVNKCAQPNRYSDDFGETLIKPLFDVDGTYGLLDDYNGYFPTEFLINPNNTKEVFTSKITPYKSNDGGETFEFSGSGYSGYLSFDWIFDDNGAIKYMSIADLGFVKFNEADGTLYPVAKKTISPNMASVTPSAGGEKVSWAKSSTSIAVDPNNPNHGFVTMGGYIYSTPSTIVETNDGFETFGVFLTLNQKVVDEGKDLSFVKYNKDNTNVIYTDYFTSFDNGESWQDNTRKIKEVSPFNGNIVYSLDGYDVYKSVDCGRTWEYTNFTLPKTSLGSYREFVADLYYEDVFWAGSHNDIYRVDLNIKKADKRASVIGRYDTSLEITGFAQNPRLKNHIVATFRDFNAGGFYVYESYDSGNTFLHLTEIPYYAGAGEVKFTPDGKRIFLGTPMGTLVYEWEGRVYTKEKRLSTAYYNEKADTFEISGNAGNHNNSSPVTLTIQNSEGVVEYVYFDYTNEYGDFEFLCKNIPELTGAYTVKVSMVDDEDMFTYSFDTGTASLSVVSPSCIYDTETKNLIVYGTAKCKEGTKIPIVLKKKAADMKNIDEFNIMDNIAYMGEALVMGDGTFVHKFKFDTKNESIFDYDITLRVGNDYFSGIDVQTVKNGSMAVNLSIKDLDGQSLVVADNKDFNAAADIKYFFEDKLDLYLIVACYEGEKLIDVFKAEKEFDYLTEKFSLSGRIKEKTTKVKVMLWSDFETLKPYAELER